MSLPKTDERILFLHNPRCTKSRAALALLEARGAAAGPAGVGAGPPARRARMRSTRGGCEWCSVTYRGWGVRLDRLSAERRLSALTRRSGWPVVARA